MTKVYIVVDCCSGDDYSQDDPTVLFVTTDEQEAIQFFEDEIENWESDLTECDSYSQPIKWGLMYECTDPINNSHRIMKMVEKELN